MRTPRILIVMTSHDDLGGRRPTGAYAPEVAEPWAAFVDDGAHAELASVDGGAPPLDGVDEADPTQARFFASVDLDRVPALADVDLAGIDAIFFAGGHGTMWDFPSDRVASAASRVWSDGGVVAAVCHGPAALVGARDGDSPLVAGRRVTGFSNSEERAAGVDDVVPFLLADRLAELGADCQEAASFTEHVVVDGRLVTGQNPQSASGTATAVLELLQR